MVGLEVEVGPRTGAWASKGGVPALSGAGVDVVAWGMDVGKSWWRGYKGVKGG